MKVAMGRDKYFVLVMSGLSLLLAGTLLWEWEQGLALERDLLTLRKIPVTALPPQKILPEFTLPDLETGFPEFLARPVFSNNRRAFVATAQAEVELMKKGQFVLVGLLISPGQRSALLRDVKTGKTETVSRMGLIRGMTLSDVSPNRVVLRLGDESEELILNVQTGPKLVAPQRTMVAPVAPAPVQPRPPASAANPGSTPGAQPVPPGLPASAPQPQTAQALIQGEKQQQAAMDQIKKQGPSVPTTPPPPAAPK